MLKIITLCILTLGMHKCIAQMNEYTKEWKAIEAAQKKGLTKTAYQLAETVKEKASKEKNNPQLIKSVMLLVAYRSILVENSALTNHFYLDTLITNTTAPARNILYSMQAELLHQFFNQNRWKYYNRTQVIDEKSTDIETWGLAKIQETISNLYTASLKDAKLLQNTPIQDYKAILTDPKNTTDLRPTVYDVLAHRALAYWSSDERNITKPAYQFYLDNPAAFAQANTFATTTFTTKDSLSNHYKALKLYQAIIKFHLPNAQPNALLDADILRYNFVKNNSTLPNKKALYTQAMQAIATHYSTNTYSALAQYYIANELVIDYKNTPLLQDNYAKAKVLCERAILNFPNSEGAANATNLLHTITEKKLTFNTETVLIPNTINRLLVSYRNTDTVYLRVIKITRAELFKLSNTDYNKLWKAYTALTPTYTATYNLPRVADYQRHTVELALQALPTGKYVLLMSTKAAFTTTNNILARDVIDVTHISAIHNSNTNAYHILNRSSGMPLAKAVIETTESYYNSEQRKQITEAGPTYTTDTHGYIKIKTQGQYKSISLLIKHNNEQLYLNSFSNSNNNYRANSSINNKDLMYNDDTEVDEYDAEDAEKKAFLFTDRSIYRPGQMLYFKGIVIQNNSLEKIEKTTTPNKKNINTKTTQPILNTTQWRVVPNAATIIVLYDANNQIVQKLNVTTNAYGSYNGTFVLPTTGLTGEYHLQDSVNESSKYFAVEEYKRPKYAVTIQQPKGTYQVYDTVKVTGIAKAYAGNMVDGAAVKYRVTRKVQYPIWYYGYGRGGYYNYNTSNTEITNGETKTDTQGQFKINFKALPDEQVNPADEPTFYYEINADVTDVNGETRSTKTTIPVRYTDVQLNVTIPNTDYKNTLPADSLHTLIISSTNANGQHVPTTVQVTINELEAPTSLLRTRYWPQADQFMYTKEQYKKIFPTDIYNNEDQASTWAIRKQVLTQEYKITQDGAFAIPKPTGLSAGHYSISLITTNTTGQVAKAIIYVECTGAGIVTNYSNPLLLTSNPNSYQPNDVIQYTATNQQGALYVLHQVDYITNRLTTDAKNVITNNGNYTMLYHNLDKGITQYTIPVTENDRGGLGTSMYYVYNNRVYAQSLNFYIPWTNKQLQLTMGTYRNLALPGSNEKFTIKITGTQGEKFAAEMLAIMYDASLDALKPHSIPRLNIYPTFNNYNTWNGTQNFEQSDATETNFNTHTYSNYEKNYTGFAFKKTTNEPLYWLNPIDYMYDDESKGNVRKNYSSVASPSVRLRGATSLYGSEQKLEEVVVTGLAAKAVGFTFSSTGTPIPPTTSTADVPTVKARKDFRETALFIPNLTTDTAGNITIAYTLPEALTQWKFMAMAHTKDVAVGYTNASVITQKPLMVQPNLPRFMREGDQVTLAVKIVNLTNKEITGTSLLQLTDATTNQSVDGWFKNQYANQYFTAPAMQSIVVKFSIEVPFGYNKPLNITATAVQVSSASNPLPAGIIAATDAEENTIPVLTNRLLVTESKPLYTNGYGTKKVSFDKLKTSATSPTLTQQGITVEYTSNPVWYAVQALPYLMEYPYECAEQTFSRYYANALASSIVNAHPAIKKVLDTWANDSTALVSNLNKNSELKTALLTETPWVLDALNETQQKKNIALLYDLNKMQKELNTSLNKLEEMQTSSGGFMWFKGGNNDRYITQTILTGIGHLAKLKALPSNDLLTVIINKAIPYLDALMHADYVALTKQKDWQKNKTSLDNTNLYYLYTRSFFTHIKIDTKYSTAYNYYLLQAQRNWLPQSKYMQGLIALTLHRNNKTYIAQDIIKSLTQNAIVNEELGMYWKDITSGYYWYQSPIETMSVLIEAYNEIENNTTTVNNLKLWLLKNKQTNNWRTTKATANACYALLSLPTISNTLQSTIPNVLISLGNNTAIRATANGVSQTILGKLSTTTSATEAGTGHFKVRIPAELVQPSMGDISITTSNTASATWGAVYWQYLEDLDKITNAATPLQLTKHIFKQTITPKGIQLTILNNGDLIQVGDKLIIRITLRADRAMEYLHLKDMRSSGTEPVNVLSQYKWQDGLGYYESTKDASSNFFISYLPKGVYLFEYPLNVSHQGNFSNGIASIQCMYAPEYTAHSQGTRITVQE